MKALPKRKGNDTTSTLYSGRSGRLNESPSEKEGKYRCSIRGNFSLICLNESPSEKEGK